MILLNEDWQPIATGPCTIEFVNSSRDPKMLYVKSAASTAMKRLPAFSQAKLLIEVAGEIQARQASGKTITCEVLDKR